MSMENNKQDFEEALEEIKGHIEALERCIDSDIMNAIKSVVDEYETHYKSDIENMIDKLCV